MGIPELNLLDSFSVLISTTFTMLKFIVSACLIAIASADITCDDCKKFETAMNAYLMSEASLAEQTELLAALLCPNTDDAAKCDEYVRGYWKEIANAVYPKFLDPTDVCTQLGTPTCDECMGSIARVAEVISSAEQIGEVVSFLQSEWCPGTDDAAECTGAVEQLIPAAMPVLGEVLTERRAEYCCKLSEDGVCC